jgi:hypothetical protein
LWVFSVPAGSKKRWGWTSRREISPTQLLIPPQNQEREKKRNIFEFESKVKNTKSKGGIKVDDEFFKKFNV